MPSDPTSARRKSSSSAAARSASVSKVSWMCGDSQKAVSDRICTIKRNTNTDCEICKDNKDNYYFCPTHKIDQSKSHSFRPVASSETLARRNKNIFQVHSGVPRGECTKFSNDKVKRGSAPSIAIAERVRTNLMRERRIEETSSDDRQEHKLSHLK